MPTRTVPLRLARWTVLAAWGAYLVTVPSAVWRVLMIVGLVPGTTDLRQFELAGNAAFAYGYVVTLSVVQLGTGFLAVGLVRPWGERFLGRRVPLVPVLVAATLGGLAVTWLFDISMVHALLTGHRPDAGLVSGVPLTVMFACYAPILLWGPLELAAAAGYGLRRRHEPAHHEQQSLPTGDAVVDVRATSATDHAVSPSVLPAGSVPATADARS